MVEKQPQPPVRSKRIAGRSCRPSIQVRKQRQSLRHLGLHDVCVVHRCCYPFSVPFKNHAFADEANKTCREATPCVDILLSRNSRDQMKEPPPESGACIIQGSMASRASSCLPHHRRSHQRIRRLQLHHQRCCRPAGETSCRPKPRLSEAFSFSLSDIADSGPRMSLFFQRCPKIIVPFHLRASSRTEVARENCTVG